MLLSQMGPIRPAGASATRRFNDGHRQWKRRILRRAWWWLASALAVYVGATLTAGNVSLVLAFSSGGMFSLWIALRESPPEWVEHWRTGGEGERRTARQLRKLRALGWSDFHDLGLGGEANVDHVLVRGTDVLILDSKNWTGKATVDADGVHIVRASDEKARWRYRPAWQITASAAELARIIHGRSDVQPWVHPVIVLWSTFPQRLVEIEGVAYVHGAHLAEWVAARPRTRPMPVTEAKILAAMAAIDPYQEPLRGTDVEAD